MSAFYFQLQTRKINPPDTCIQPIQIKSSIKIMKIIAKISICEETIWRKLFLREVLAVEKYTWILRKKQKFLKTEKQKLAGFYTERLFLEIMDMLIEVTFSFIS